MHEKKLSHCSSPLKPSHPGFTLIELLVSVTIILILTGGAIAGYIKFNDRQTAFTTAKEVQQWYRIAQQKAAVREVPDGVAACQPTSKFFGYRIYNVDSTFSRRALCGNSLETAGAAGTAVTYVVPSGVSLEYSGTDTVRFYSLQEGTNLGATQEIKIKFTKGSATYSFTINSKGAISDVKKD